MYPTCAGAGGRGLLCDRSQGVGIHPTNQTVPNPSSVPLSFCGILNISTKFPPVVIPSPPPWRSHPFGVKRLLKLATQPWHNKGSPRACQLVQVVYNIRQAQPTNVLSGSATSKHVSTIKGGPNPTFIDIIRVPLGKICKHRKENWCVGHEYYILIVFVMARFRFLLET